MQQLHDREILRICKNCMGVVSNFVSPRAAVARQWSEICLIVEEQFTNW